MTTPFENIDVHDGDARVRSGAVLVDVRRLEEWAAGHAPDAVHLPIDELAARHGELPIDRPLVLICRSGGRSAVATEALVEAGYEAANVAGGMQAWIDAGLPCVTDDGAPGTVA